MKTTDSVKREKLYVELVGAVARGWTTKENEKKVMDTELAKAITEQVFDLYSHSLAEARREWVEEIEKLKQWSYSYTYECPKCSAFYGKDDTYCTNDRTKIVKKEMKYPETLQEPYNQAIDDVIDLLTGDNPERKV